MNSKSIESVYMSWDQIKTIPDYEEVFGLELFTRIHDLSPRVGAIFYSEEEKKPNVQHARLFSSMIDLIVHMLGPDMDPVTDQLFELGERHAKYGVSSRHFPIVGDALIATLESLLGEKRWKESVKDAWLSLYRYMSLTMIRGVRSVNHQQRKSQSRSTRRRPKPVSVSKRKKSLDSETKKKPSLPIASPDGDNGELAYYETTELNDTDFIRKSTKWTDDAYLTPRRPKSCVISPPKVITIDSSDDNQEFGELDDDDDDYWEEDNPKKPGSRSLGSTGSTSLKSSGGKDKEKNKGKDRRQLLVHRMRSFRLQRRGRSSTRNAL